MSLAANCYKLHAVVWDGNGLYQIQVEGDLYEVLLEFFRLASSGYSSNYKLREVQLLAVTKQHPDKCVDYMLIGLGPDATEEDKKQLEEYYWSNYKPPRVIIDDNKIVITPPGEVAKT